MSPATRRRLLAGVAAAFAAALAVVAGLRTASLTVFAHRGFAGEVPENTVEAVRYARDRADAIEVDVRRSASGELVCVHDERLDRLTEATGRVSEIDWETLQTLTVGDSEARIARLEEVVAEVPPSLLLNVELKERGLAPDVIAALESHEGAVIVSSFDPTALTQVRSLAPDLPLAYIYSEREGALETAADLECVAVHPSKGLCFRPGAVSAAHDRGFDVNAWTVAGRLEAAALAAVGVDGVFADSPL